MCLSPIRGRASSSLLQERWGKPHPSHCPECLVVPGEKLGKSRYKWQPVRHRASSPAPTSVLVLQVSESWGQLFQVQWLARGRTLVFGLKACATTSVSFVIPFLSMPTINWAYMDWVTNLASSNVCVYPQISLVVYKRTSRQYEKVTQVVYSCFILPKTWACHPHGRFPYVTLSSRSKLMLVKHGSVWHVCPN